ncbi:hypothetical protein NQ317_015303, partial [Molorchus minor]
WPDVNNDDLWGENPTTVVQQPPRDTAIIAPPKLIVPNPPGRKLNLNTSSRACTIKTKMDRRNSHTFISGKKDFVE